MPSDMKARIAREFAELARTKSIDKITVKDIVEACHITRQTFYYHFQDLIDVTRQSFFEGIKYAKEGYRLFDISAAIQQYVESHGYSIVREYVGHGVGAQMHESPEIPNYGHPGRGPRLLRGMTLAIEPMVNAGSAAIQQMSDGWTVKTLDGKWAAHYENSILITDGEPEILTAPAI